MAGEVPLRACLRRHWGLTGVRVMVHNTGMNSVTWLVEDGGRRWVAKSVASAAGAAFVSGLAVARRLEQAGIRAGAPVPTAGGQMVADLAGAPLALLSWVPGEELTGADREQRRLIGTTLAQVHQVLAGRRVDGAARFHWVDPAGEHLGVRAWVRPAVTAAVAALEELGPSSLTWGLLHTDPAPEAFRYDQASEVCGVIDWSVAMCGPLLYDLASALMYVGGIDAGGDLLDAYLSGGTLTTPEVDRGLATMLRFRWAVQADYFARRVTSGDLTGITDPQANEDGLEHARQYLTNRPQ